MSEFSISAKLLELRKEKGATQDEVALALSVSNKTISKWETGASEPDLDTLVKLSKYYDVTTDTPLGLKDESRSTREVISNEFRDLDGGEMILKAFDLTIDMIPALQGVWRSVDRRVEPIPSKKSEIDRYRISTDDFLDYVVRSDDANIAVMLLKNKADFNWMRDSEKQKGIVKLLSALAEPAALSICWFIHNEECSKTFTAEYISSRTGVDVQSAVKVLDSFCDIPFCTKRIAHVKDREVTVYDAHDGDSLILSIITLAFDLVHGSRSYNHFVGSGCKMVGGAKK